MRTVAVVALFLLIAAAVPATSSSPAGTLTDEQQAYLADHGPLNVLLGPTGPPLTSVGDDGRTRGIMPDFLALMTVRLGVEFNVTVAASWPEVYAALENGTYDLVGPFTYIEDREEVGTYIGPFYWARLGFWVSDRTPGVDTVADLEGRVVGVAAPHLMDGLAETYPDVSFTNVGSPEAGLDALLIGEVDALYAGYANVGYFARNRSITNVTTLGDPDTVTETYWMVPDDHPEVAGIVGAAMASIGEDERLAIYVKWTGLDMGPPVEPQGDVLAVLTPLQRGILAGGAGLLVLLGVGTVVLRRQVKARTRELSDLNAQLESEVRRRTRELERSNRELEAFNYAVSHDLRTPLTSIRTYAAVFRKKSEKRLTGEELGYLDRIDVGVERTADLIDGMLQLSRASRGEIRHGNVDLSRIAEDVVADLRAGEPGRRVEVTVEPGLMARGDHALLTSVFENLVGNAWKYTRATPDARIDVGVSRRGGRTVYHVHDNGMGFDPAHAEDLFRPFHRLPGAEGEAGIGVGLTTVQRIIDRHGGEVWADGSPGKGCTIRFTLGEAS